MQTIRDLYVCWCRWMIPQDSFTCERSRLRFPANTGRVTDVWGEVGIRIKKPGFFGKPGFAENLYTRGLLAAAMLSLAFAFAEHHLSQANHLRSDFNVLVPLDVLQSQLQSQFARWTQQHGVFCTG